MMLSQYVIYASWQDRPDTCETLAARFLHLLDQLRPLYPTIDNWFWGGNRKDYEEKDRPDRLQTVLPNFVEAVASTVALDDWDEPQPFYGYSPSVLTSDGKTTSSSISVSIRGGGQPTSVDSSSGSIETGWRISPDPTLVAYDVFKPALLALAETFGFQRARANPADLQQHWRVKESYRPGWMSYLGPRYASLVTPPPGAIVERRSDGGLFMAATKETFLTQNPTHLQMAHAIEAALAPVNALAN